MQRISFELYCTKTHVHVLYAPIPHLYLCLILTSIIQTVKYRKKYRKATGAVIQNYQGPSS